MSEALFAARTVTCPTCRGDSAYSPANPYRPFCSARCRSNDFGAWATEDYRIEPNERAGGDANSE